MKPLTILIPALALAAQTHVAEAEPANLEAMRALQDASILLHEGGLSTNQETLPGVVRVLVRLVDAEGRTVFDEWSDAGAIELDATGLADGLYRWDVVSVVRVDAADTAEPDAPAVRTLRRTGLLRVEGGQVSPVGAGEFGAHLDGDELGIRASSMALRLAGRVLEWFSGTAHASEDFFTDVFISANLGGYAKVHLGEQPPAVTANIDWTIAGDNNEFLVVQGERIGFPILRFPRGIGGAPQASKPADFSLIVDDIGDLTLLDGMYSFDRSDGRLGINRTPSSLGGNFQVEDVRPRISLWDADEPSGPAQMFLNFDDGEFGIWSTDLQTLFPIVNLNMSAPSDSLNLSASGDLDLAGAVTVDRSLGALGVGRHPGEFGGQLQLESEEPWVSFHRAGGGLAQVNFDGEYLSLGKAVSVRGEIGFLDRVRFSMDASGNALVLDSDGNLGLGGNSEGTALAVQRNDGSAQIYVKESAAAPAPRTLFRLSNPGNTKFEIEESSSGNSWAFTNSGSDFRVSLQDSGVVEFRVDNAGDAYLAGALTQNSDVNAKQLIRPIDPQEILERIVSLPVSRWQYKDAPGIDHLGPMAQDFFAAFGLGAGKTGIATLDSSGVALAAIQALAGEARDAARRQESLARENGELRRRNAELEQRVSWLEARFQEAVDLEPIEAPQSN